MRTRNKLVLNIVLMGGILIAMVAAPSIAQKSERSDSANISAVADGVLAYIYGYPLVMMALTQRVSTTVPGTAPGLTRAPINQLVKETELPNGSYKDVVLPSTTTLYVASFINLTAEPQVLHLPDINRFYLMQILDAWTNVSQESPGTRRGSQPGDYALVGPNWDPSAQPLPAGVNMIRMPTNTAWLIGRIFTSGTPDDLNYLNTVVIPQITLAPLSAGPDYQPPSNLPVDPSIDTVTPPVRQVANMDACAFFGTLAAMMKTNPPLPPDDPVVKRLAKINIVPGQSFDCSDPNLDRETKAALQLAVVAAKKTLESGGGVEPTSTNWFVLTDNLGDYGTEYLLRAIVAKQALGANLPEDAVYGYATMDNGGNPLKAGNRYVVSFEAGQLPPVNPAGFWSVTIYNADGTLVDNPVVNYNAIGVGPLGPTIQDHNACFNADGSLDLYFQADQPSDPTQRCNWIPISPQGSADPTKNDFIVFLRMYWPDQVVLDGGWIPPAVQKLN